MRLKAGSNKISKELAKAKKNIVKQKKAVHKNESGRV